MAYDPYRPDRNGNDPRYGCYWAGEWCPDPPEIVASKRSGEWRRLSRIQRRWMYESYCRPSAAALAEIDGIVRGVKDFFKGLPRT
jgi:hypothetical protein